MKIDDVKFELSLVRDQITQMLKELETSDDKNAVIEDVVLNLRDGIISDLENIVTNAEYEPTCGVDSEEEKS